MSDAVLCERDTVAHIGRITLNRPAKSNALSLDMIAAFCESLASLESDDDIKVIVISGNGGNLCAGQDASELETMYRRAAGKETARVPSQRARLAAHDELWWGPSGLFGRLLHCRKITVVAARGACLGPGLHLCLCGDLVVASDDASFACPRWRHVGVDGDISVLAAAVGLKRARELMFCSEPWTAQQAHAYGLVDEVAAGDRFDSAVENLAASCAMIMRDGIATEKQVVFASLAKMQINTGQAMASVVAGWASNIHHRKGEFNFLREAREHGIAGAMRRSRDHFDE